MLARRHSSGVIFAAAIIIGATASGCSSPADLARVLQTRDVATGWFDAGIVDGKNKLVPSITFRLRNSSNEALKLQMNIVYVILPERDDRDDVFLQNVNVPASGVSTPITVRSKYGFTGEQPRAEMLQHRLFQDFQVRLFAKHESGQWVPLGEYSIDRTLLTR